MRAFLFVAIFLVFSAGFTEGPDKSVISVDTELTVDAHLILSSKDQIPAKALEQMRSQLKESGLPQPVIDETLARHQKSQPERRSNRRLVLVADGVNFLGEVISGEGAGTVQATDGRLVATKLSLDKEPVWTVERTSSYSLSHVLASGLWPVYVGMVRMNQADFVTPLGESSWKYSSGPRTTAFVALSNEQGRKVYESRYGAADVPQTKATIFSDRTVITESDLKGKIVQTLSLEKINSGPADEDRRQLARSLGKEGEPVVDCRFGEKECVTYLHPGKLLSDEEVQEMLRRKQPEKNYGNGEANTALVSGSLIVVGIGVVIVGLFMVMKGRQSK